MSSKEATTLFIVRCAMIIIMLIALVYIAIITEVILAPLFLSLLFALLLIPVANFLERKLLVPRAAAALLAVVILIFFLAAIFYLLGSQVAHLAYGQSSLKEQLHASLNDLQSSFAERFHIDIKKQISYVDKITSNAMSSGTVEGATVLSLSTKLLFPLLSAFFTFFLLLYRRLLLTFLFALFPEKKPVVYNIVKDIQYIIRRYILGLLLEMLIVAAIGYASFLIFGVKYALLFSLTTAVFNIIPYAGIFTSLVISAFITFAIGGGTVKVLVVIVTIIAIHLIDGNILLPFVVGSKIRINGMATIIAVIAGEMIWGIPGMFLSIPFLAMIRVIFDSLDTLKPWGILLGTENIKGKIKRR